MNDVPEGFKMTELGALPEEWNCLSFENAVLKTRVQIKKINKSEYKQIGIIPVVDQGQNFVAGYWDDISDAYYGELPVIIFGDHTRIFKFINFPFVAGADGVKVIVPKKKLYDAKFLYFTLSNLDIPNRGYNRHYSLLREKFIPRPPFPEQQAIAKVLSTVQEAREKTEVAIEATRELKKSLMKHLFTYGPVPLQEADKVALKETLIGLVPENWEIVELRQATLKTKNVNPVKKPKSVFKYIDVSGVSNESLRIQSYTEYIGKDAPSRARKHIKHNDVIFATVRPYLKRVAYVPPELDDQVCSTAFCVIRAHPKLADPSYLFYYTSSDTFVQRVSEQQKGSSYPAVTDKDVLNQLIPLPLLAEQQAIGRVLSSVDRRIEAKQDKKDALDALFQTLLQDLMTAKIRVNHMEIAQ